MMALLSGRNPDGFRPTEGGTPGSSGKNNAHPCWNEYPRFKPSPTCISEEDKYKAAPREIYPRPARRGAVHGPARLRVTALRHGRRRHPRHGAAGCSPLRTQTRLPTASPAITIPNRSSQRPARTAPARSTASGIRIRGYPPDPARRTNGDASIRPHVSGAAPGRLSNRNPARTPNPHYSLISAFPQKTAEERRESRAQIGT
jgi:hypothetical protein